MNNNHPQISVIVPVYNAEKYLTQCIDSILEQDFTDYELLLIDDGSKDQSGAICDEYAKNDKRIKVFHKKNGGVSSARNLGIDEAQGEYIAFIDSDDYVDSNYLSILNCRDADLVVTGYASFEYNINHIVEECKYTDAIYTDNKIAECLSSVLNDTSMRSPWDKLFRGTIIKKHKIYFNTYLRIAEDTVFVQTYLQYCHKIVFRSGTPYYYRLELGKVSYFKYSLSSNEYLYSLTTVLNTYKNITEHFDFTNSDYHLCINKLMLMLYYRHLAKEGFSLKEYTNYKQTMKQLCPKVLFSEKLYVISYKLLRKNMFFLSYFMLSFVYPLKLLLKK